MLSFDVHRQSRLGSTSRISVINLPITAVYTVQGIPINEWGLEYRMDPFYISCDLAKACYRFLNSKDEVPQNAFEEISGEYETLQITMVG
ncbi:hypothetical protein HI914_04698 [Erysiphe necator]|nr:hypothetical protein HI914_04698 [Erysiphe necator]